ncbi:MAG: murein biosynthesis integral membrane protein MurJ [Candidatus Cloacimonetes bacterium]|nr:murein biosynthesis integral membrane protein MurJ [Candidatus Cloacimonadota bacterium]
MTHRQLARNIGSMSLAVFFSRITGLVRDIFMTNYFGTTAVADAFQVAYQIPNLLRKLFGEGALSAAFVPLYNEFGIKRGKREQFRFALNILSLLSLLLLILCIIGIFIAPLLVRVLAPGFDHSSYQLALKLTRIMFPYLFLIGISSTLISILNSHDYFFLPGLSTALLNLAMIGTLGIFVLWQESSTIEERIVVWSWGVILGGFFQVVINLPLLKKLGYSVRIILSTGGEALRSLLRRFIPGAIGIGIRQINLWVDLILASFLATGSIAALSYGNRLMQLPLGIFGVSAGVAVLPLFSRYVTEEKWSDLQESLRFAVITVCWIMIPITMLIAGLGRDLIRLIFMRGAFDEISLAMTFQALVCYSLGLVFFSLNRLLIPIFYANKNTRTPVKITAVIVVINIILNLILMRYLQHAGLALATTLSSLIQYIVLRSALRKKVPGLHFPGVKTELVKIFILSTSILGGLLILNHLYRVDESLNILFKIVLGLSLYFIILILGTRIMKITYTGRILDVIWKKFH